MGRSTSMRTALALSLLVLLGACSDTADPAAVESAAEETVDAVADDAPAEVAESEVTFTSVPVADISADHVQPPVSFSTSPSTGGPHYPFWMNCGFYDRDVMEGAATHSMEHGAVWITYNPERVTADDLSALEEMAKGNGKLLISAYDHPEKIVLSAWGVQHRQDDLSPGDAAMTDFVTTWVDNPDLPEAGVTCQDAIGFPPNDVYRVIADGTEIPEEWR